MSGHHAAGLTGRQQQVLALYADNYSYAGICRVLSLHKSTVVKHLRVAREKLGAVDSDHAVTIARRLGVPLAETLREVAA